VRKVVFGTMPFLLSDTVGFIRKLPHHLVESFKSTLDEVKESDILLHVVDLAHPQHEDHIRTVEKTLRDLDAANKPTLLVFNKMDLYRERYFDEYLDDDTGQHIMEELADTLKNNFEKENIFISAHTKENINALRNKMIAMIEEQYHIRYPYETKNW
jgi:GTP-binding protein HflX